MASSSIAVTGLVSLVEVGLDCPIGAIDVVVGESVEGIDDGGKEGDSVRSFISRFSGMRSLHVYASVGVLGKQLNFSLFEQRIKVSGNAQIACVSSR